MVDAPASVPESALATQPASKQPVTKALSAQQNLHTQLKLQEDTQQVGNETVHTCKLQAGLHLLIESATHLPSLGSSAGVPLPILCLD